MNSTSSALSPQVVRYTFGNHMHWTDMQWLWGWRTLPDSLDDMIRLCQIAGVRGNLNWDAIAFDKLAAENPDALQRLRSAITDGEIDPVGGSWAQPYGLFVGGESNLRQFEWGLRTTLRHLKCRPVVFWEEEFWMHPQLPQMLKQCGFEAACLFFQWTWHTPELPIEQERMIAWQGIDGSQLPTFPRHPGNLHQWPEEFQTETMRTTPPDWLVQWLELMPSPDWMCRSELIAPILQTWQQSEQVDFRPGTLRDFYAEFRHDEMPVRSYGQDQLWHGMSLGKNGDQLPRAWGRVERLLLQAETLAAINAHAGRPYPSWGAVPTWELHEGWSELLASQHHDNHECEGLCGFIGHDAVERAARIAGRVVARSARNLARRLGHDHHGHLLVNRLAHPRRIHVAELGLSPEIPACGYRFVSAEEWQRCSPRWAVSWNSHQRALTLADGESTTQTGVALNLRRNRTRIDLLAQGPRATLPSGDQVSLRWCPLPQHDAVRWEIELDHHDPPDPGMNAGVRLQLGIGAILELAADHPYGWQRLRADTERPRKYPRGDWMTSEQWYENIARPFTALRWVETLTAEGRQLWVHDGSQQWFREENGLAVLLNMKDPWDEEYWQPRTGARLWQIPDPPLDPEQRERLVDALLENEVVVPLPLAKTDRVGCVGGGPVQPDSILEKQASILCHHGAGRVTAVRALDPRDGEEFPHWAGTAMHCPWLIRIVESAGQRGLAKLHFASVPASAVRVNALGENPHPLKIVGHRISCPLEPHQILSLMVDLPAAAMVPRKLDQDRDKWAHAHRPER